MKEPKPQKLPSGNYRVRLRLGDEDISITRATSEECRAAALEVKTEYKLGKRIAASKEARELTLKEVQERYIEKNKAVLSPSTLRSYKIYAKTRFPAYQKTKLKDLDFQQVIDDELDLKSEKTVKNAWGLLRTSLEAAGYPVPKVRLAPVPVNEIPFLQPAEIAPFCDALIGRSYEIPALMLLHGLRLSEMRGLTWGNIDLKNGVMTVKGALVRGPDGDVNKKQNKNATSTRPVPIMIPRLLELLKAADSKTGPVVVIGAGTMLDDVKRACKRAGVTEVTCHGLRHSFASLCYYLEIPERQIQEWGGWKDRATLHRIYIRLTAAGQSEAQAKVTSFFGK
jgi:integrase